MNNPLAGTDPSGYMAHIDRKGYWYNKAYGGQSAGLSQTKAKDNGNTEGDGGDTGDKPEPKIKDNSNQSNEPQKNKLETIYRKKFKALTVFSDGSVKIDAKDGTSVTVSSKGMQPYYKGGDSNFKTIYKGSSGGKIRAQNTERKKFFSSVYGVVAVAAAINKDVLEDATLNGSKVLIWESMNTDYSFRESSAGKPTYHQINFNHLYSFRGQSAASGLIHELGHAGLVNTVGDNKFKSSIYWDSNNGKISGVGEQAVTDRYETRWIRALGGEEVRRSYSDLGCRSGASCAGKTSNVWNVYE